VSKWTVSKQDFDHIGSWVLDRDPFGVATDYSERKRNTRWPWPVMVREDI